MHYEREMLELCRRLYTMNGDSEVMVIQGSRGDDPVDNPYARLTMNLEDRKLIRSICWKCVIIEELPCLLKAGKMWMQMCRNFLHLLPRSGYRFAYR